MTDQKYRDGSVAEEASATGQRIKGAIKDTVGEMTDNERLEAEGERDLAEGRARQDANDAIDSDDLVGSDNHIEGHDDESAEPHHPPDTIREETSATGQRIKGEVKNVTGAITGNDRLEREGESEAEAGRIRQKKNDAV